MLFSTPLKYVYQERTYVARIPIYFSLLKILFTCKFFWKIYEDYTEWLW